MNRKFRGCAALIAAIALLPGVAADAAPPPVPDAGVQLQSVKPLPAPPPAPRRNLIDNPPDTRPAMKPDDGIRVKLKAVRFSGVASVKEADLQALVRPDLGLELSFPDLDAIAVRVTTFYREHGFTVTRAYLPEQNLADGVLEIAVLEGHLGKVQVKFQSEGGRTSERVLSGLVEGAVPAGAPITNAELERALLLENDLPNITAHGTLIPGASVGTSDLVLEATQSGWFSRNTLEADNAGNRYSGTARAGGSVNVASPAGLGDLFSVRALSSFKGFDYGRFSWTVPIASSGWKAGISETATYYRLGGTLEPLKDHGDARVLGIFSVYPVVRSRDFNLYQTLTLESKSLYDAAVTGTVANKRSNVLSLGANIDATDGWHGGGISNASATIGLGHLSLGTGAADYLADQQTARSAGSFAKIDVQASRQQRISDSWVFYSAVNGQWSSKNLDSSESLGFGGPGAVRAYPTGEAPADEGAIATIEARYNFAAPANLGSMQAQIFVDDGEVRLHHTPWTTFNLSKIPNSYNLKSAGVGLNLVRDNSLFVSLSVARKIGSNPAHGLQDVDSDGRSNSTRAWIQLVKYL
jgi:hemolysin activation/secretion protein